MAQQLHELESEADTAARLVADDEPPSLVVRVSASVPSAAAALGTATLHADLPALSAALGAHVLQPVGLSLKSRS